MTTLKRKLSLLERYGMICIPENTHAWAQFLIDAPQLLVIRINRDIGAENWVDPIKLRTHVHLHMDTIVHKKASLPDGNDAEGPSRAGRFIFYSWSRDTRLLASALPKNPWKWTSRPHFGHFQTKKSVNIFNLDVGSVGVLFNFECKRWRWRRLNKENISDALQRADKEPFLCQ